MFRPSAINKKKVELAVVNKENVGEVKGMLAVAKNNANGAMCVYMLIPRRLLGIDQTYQFPGRTERDMSYLVNNWNERLLDALTVVPHPEEGRFVITDGYGRYVASEIVDAKKYSSLMCRVILDAPEDPEKRRKFEASLYADQNKVTAVLRPYHKHGAMMVIGDKATENMDKAMRKYGYSYPKVGRGGKRKTRTVGSYSTTLRISKQGGFDELDCIFSITSASRFDEQKCGLSSYIMFALADVYRLYGNKYHKMERHFIKVFRSITPTLIIANARTKYPYQMTRMAVSLYLEDSYLDSIKVARKRKEDSETKKIIILNPQKSESNPA